MGRRKKKGANRRISFTADRVEIARLDRIASEYERRVLPGTDVSRAVALRAAMLVGAGMIEAEYGLAPLAVPRCMPCDEGPTPRSRLKKSGPPQSGVAVSFVGKRIEVARLDRIALVYEAHVLRGTEVSRAVALRAAVLLGLGKIEGDYGLPLLELPVHERGDKAPASRTRRRRGAPSQSRVGGR